MQTLNHGTNRIEQSPLNFLATEHTGGDVPAEDVHGSEIFLPPERRRLLGLIELILKDRVGLERAVREPSRQGVYVSRFVAIALVGFTVFGVALAVVLGSLNLWPALAPLRDVLSGRSDLLQFEPVEAAGHGLSVWVHAAPYELIAAYDLGLIAAVGICLPSLYFYGLLAGVRMTMLDAVVHATKALAVTATALVGIVPIFVAFAIGIAIFPLRSLLLHESLWLGLLLPFVAGLWGIHSLFAGFLGLADTLPAECRYRRQCFLRRLVLSWTVCYVAVSPVMVFSLWELFARGG